MKKFIILTLICLALMPVCALAKPQPQIKFAETSYNFGTVPEKGGKITHTFTFTNTGDANLMIVDATADCGCTEPKYPTAPIKPGESGTIKVTYDPKYRPGAFTKNITVRTNAKPKKTTLKISGIVK